MERFLRKFWWKYVSLSLLAFGLIGGLLIPTDPSITSIHTAENNQDFSAGKTYELEIWGYNTHFEKGDEGLLVFFFDSTSNTKFCARGYEVLSPTVLQASVDVPIQIPGEEGIVPFDMVVIDSKDGTIIMEDYFRVKTTGVVPPDAGKDYCGATPAITERTGLSLPNLFSLYETIRNLFFHVPMWFAMTFLLLISAIYSIRYLNHENILDDLMAVETARVALLLGALGIVTGMIWATFTWGAPWPNDPKLNGAAVGMAIYFAYFILRGSLGEEKQRAKVSSVYSIFGFVMFIVFIFVWPRLQPDSVHPGMSNNPGFSDYDLDNTMRPVFYAAVIGFMGIGLWIAGLRVRYIQLKHKQLGYE